MSTNRPSDRTADAVADVTQFLWQVRPLTEENRTATARRVVQIAQAALRTEPTGPWYTDADLERVSRVIASWNNGGTSGHEHTPEEHADDARYILDAVFVGFTHVARSETCAVCGANNGEHGLIDGRLCPAARIAAAGSGTNG